MSEAKYLELIDIYKQQGDTERQIKAMEGLKSFRATPPEVSPQRQPPQQEMRKTTRGMMPVGVPQPAQKDIFRGLPEDVVDRIRAESTGESKDTRGRYSGVKFNQVTAERKADLERIRQDNPALADLIEETVGFDAFTVGAGRGLTNVGRGISRPFTDVTPEQQADRDVETAAFKGLQSQTGAATAGEIAGEAAPFLIPGVGLEAGLAKVGSGLAARSLAAGTLGGLEGGIISAGRGDSPAKIAISAFLGGATLGISEAAIPLLNRRASALALRKELDVSGPMLTKEGLPTDEFKGVLKEEGITYDQFVQEAAAEGMQEASTAIKQGSQEAVAKMINPDPKFYQAIEEMGFSSEPLASFASQNPQFRAVEMGLASIPASPLDVQAKAFIGEAAEKADDLILKYGGTKDKSELSTRFREDSVKSIDDIYASESKVYDLINTQLPGNTKVKAGNITTFIESKAAKMGGMDKFSKQYPRLAKMHSQLKTTIGKSKIKPGKPGVTGATRVKGEDVNPSYEILNDIRREIGQQLGRKGDTTFRTTETGLLKQVYAKLKADQNQAATNAGLKSSVEAADALTMQRKQIEDNLKGLLGKDLQKDLMPIVGQAIKGLAKDNVTKFINTIDSIPKQFRKEAVVSSLNDIFKGGGAHNAAFDSTQFMKFMDKLNQSKVSKKALYKNLPKEARRDLNNLHTIAKGISISKQDAIQTGRVAALFDENNGMISRLMNGGIKIAATVKGGPMAGMAVSELLTGATNSAKSASMVLNSPSFQNAIRAAAKDGSAAKGTLSARAEKLQAKFESSKAFKEWNETLSENARTSVANLGTVIYLIGQKEQETK